MAEEPITGRTAADIDLEAVADSDIELTSVVRTEADDLTASMSAIASAKVAGPLSATASAVGVATVSGDVTANLSSLGAVATSAQANVNQSYAGMVASNGDLRAHQTLASTMIARTASIEQGAAGVVAGSQVQVRRGFVGLLLASEADLSEDTRVLLSGRSLGVMAVAVLGGFGLVALGVWLAGKQLAAMRRR